MTQFKKIGILGRLESASVANTLEKLIHLLDDKNIEYAFESALKDSLPGPGYVCKSRADLGAESDLIIVVGGDGTLLGVARDLAEFETPVLGINRGRLGFLTDIMPEETDQKVSEVLDGDYVLEHRFLLEVKVVRDGEVIQSGSALNDVVLHPGQSIRMIEFELLVDGQFVYSQRSDGLIVSTPTGSTAYALSAGGPIMHPNMNAMVLVPMFPHALTSRPLMIDGDSRVAIRIGRDNILPPQVSCDAQEHLPTEAGDILEISKLKHRLNLLHPSRHEYYETCRTKLGWGKRLAE